MEPQQGSDTRLTHVGMPPLIKLMGIEHREDTVGVGGREHAVANTPTPKQCYSCYTGWMEPRARIRHNLDTCRRGPPLIKWAS